MRIFLFAIVWALTLPACTGINLLQLGWTADNALFAAIIPFGIGAFAASFAAIYCAAAISWHKSSTARFSALFVVLTAFTLFFAAIAFSLHNRIFHSNWHDSALSWVWTIRSFLPSIGSLYLFAANGVILLLPWGIVGLTLASAVFSRGWFVRAR